MATAKTNEKVIAISVPFDLWRKYKMMSFNTGMSIAELGKTALEKYLKGKDENLLTLNQ